MPMPPEGRGDAPPEEEHFPFDQESIDKRIDKLTNQITELETLVGYHELALSNDRIDGTTKEQHIERLNKIQTEVSELDNELSNLKDIKEKFIRRSKDL